MSLQWKCHCWMLLIYCILSDDVSFTWCFFLIVEEQMLLVLIRLLYCCVIYTLQTNRVDSVKSNLYSSEGYLWLAVAGRSGTVLSNINTWTKMPWCCTWCAIMPPCRSVSCLVHRLKWHKRPWILVCLSCGLRNCGNLKYSLKQRTWNLILGQ